MADENLERQEVTDCHINCKYRIVVNNTLRISQKFERVAFIILTGCLRISKESVFTDLNNYGIACYKKDCKVVMGE